MEPIVERCCGLDVHQASVVASVMLGGPHEKPRQQLRRFPTFTPDLIEMRDWLKTQGVTHVGMESTGVYWKPVHALLEGHFHVVIGNAQHIRNVPGRKTDVKDSEWIADLVRHGLIRNSFVPPPAIRALRDLVRYRRKLVNSRTAERNRLLKLLEGANIKIASVASDVFGVSGMRMLRALVHGESTPQGMADLAIGRLREKAADLERALEGRWQSHQRPLLALQLRRLEQVDEDLATLDRQINEHLEPYRELHELLIQIPGVERVLAATLIAELGTDMSVFPTHRHCAAWAGVSPGNHQSAGKPKNAQARHGNVHLTTALVEAAQSAVRTRGTYFRDKFYRLKARRGHNRAIMAIAHKILVAAYHMLATRTPFRDLGEVYLDQHVRARVKAQLVRRLERLGYVVQIEPKPA